MRVVDEQPSPGGQIWRNIETVAGTRRASILGKAYDEGVAVVGRFRASGVEYEPETQLWHVEAGARAFLRRGGSTSSVEADCVLLAMGAQERPAPFPGWTLPGVMTVGAAQIVLKSSGQIPDEPVWIAGSGPLPLLYAVALGIALSFFGIELPAPIGKTVALIGNLTVPLMLLMLGASLSRLRVASFGRAAMVSAFRIAGGALVGILVASLFDLSGSMKAVLIMQSANPVAVYNYLFAQRWNNEPEEVAGVVVLSTMISIATIPLLLGWLAAAP